MQTGFLDRLKRRPAGLRFLSTVGNTDGRDSMRAGVGGEHLPDDGELIGACGDVLNPSKTAFVTVFDCKLSQKLLRQ